MTYAELPSTLEIDGRTCVLHWRSRDMAIYQSYTAPLSHDANDLADMRQMRFDNTFDLYRIIRLNPGEQLGEKLGTYTTLHAAIDRATKEGIVA